MKQVALGMVMLGTFFTAIPLILWVWNGNVKWAYTAAIISGVFMIFAWIAQREGERE